LEKIAFELVAVSLAWMMIIRSNQAASGLILPFKECSDVLT